MESDKKITTEISPKNTDIISYFDKDVDFVFSYKKTEKLASAVYIITGLFSENEPMKWVLRKKVSELLSFIITYKDIPKSKLNDFIYNTKTRVLELISLLEISFRGGLISEMNFSILKNEFSILIDRFNIDKSASKDFSQEVISRDFFDLTGSNLPIGSGHISRQTGSMSMTNTNFAMSHNLLKDRDSGANYGRFFKRSNRQNTILNLLKKKKELTIKDIAEVVKDCSEKTIQRELISFISAGMVKRAGERRWSKYSLVQ